MGFRKFINSNKILSLVTAFMLLGNNVLMAQTEASGSATAAPTESKSDMWMGVGYYVLLFLLLCVVVAIIGKVLNVYYLYLKM